MVEVITYFFEQFIDLTCWYPGILALACIKLSNAKSYGRFRYVDFNGGSFDRDFGGATCL